MAIRVVSLAPSATATMHALGRRDVLVGQTDHDGGDATTIGDWLTPDPDAITALEPDVGVTTDPLQAEIAHRLRERGFAVAHFAPVTLEGIGSYICDIGELIGAEREAKAVAVAFTTRIERVRARRPRGGTDPSSTARSGRTRRWWLATGCRKWSTSLAGGTPFPNRERVPDVSTPRRSRRTRRNGCFFISAGRARPWSRHR